MNNLSRYLDDAYMAWLSSSINCCAPLKEQAPRRGIEKPMRIEHQQPRLVPPPIPESQERPSTRGREWVERSKSFASRASSRGSFSVRRKLNAYNGYNRPPRRPRISSPTEFRHVENGNTPRRTGGFRPLELSIYMPENQLSPMLPHFGTIDDLSHPSRYSKELPFPPMAHSRSESAMSFRIPRKPVRSSTGASSYSSNQFGYRPESLSTQQLMAALDNEMPRAPPAARLRSKTEPPAYERVKSALHERYELEQKLKEIEETIEERKSIYMSSRPTSRATMRPQSIYSEHQEPMPPAPIITSFTTVPIPPIAPSFAERISTPSPTQRPRTAPSKTVHIPARLKSFSEASATFTTPSPSPATSSRPPSRPGHQLQDTLPPPPPLPLVLSAPHPPLRNNKSFSRVSSWLFPSEHTRNISMDSVTNTPKPVTSREGFYQCIDLGASTSQTTFSTLENQSELEENEQTIPTNWTTPDSSPAIRQGSLDSGIEGNGLERTRTFGEKDGDEMRESWRMELPLPEGHHGHGRNSVGVAF